jgi:hypothetical protein
MSIHLAHDARVRVSSGRRELATQQRQQSREVAVTASSKEASVSSISPMMPTSGQRRRAGTRRLGGVSSLATTAAISRVRVVSE